MAESISLNDIDDLRAELAAVAELHAADMARKEAEVKALRGNCMLLQAELADVRAQLTASRAHTDRLQDAKSGLYGELRDMRSQWAADVGSAVARAQTAEDAQRRAERDLAASNRMIDELSAHISELEARTDPYPQEDLIRRIEQHRAAARKVAQAYRDMAADGEHDFWTEHNRAEAMKAERDAARAEAARLAAALERIRDKAESWEGRSDAPYWNLGDIARAALRVPAQSEQAAADRAALADVRMAHTALNTLFDDAMRERDDLRVKLEEAYKALEVIGTRKDTAEAALERLTDAAKGRGMVSEMADMSEVAVLVCGLHDRAELTEAALAQARALAHELCLKIETLPASELQTEISIMASSLAAALSGGAR